MGPGGMVIHPHQLMAMAALAQQQQQQQGGNNNSVCFIWYSHLDKGNSSVLPHMLPAMMQAQLQAQMGILGPHPYSRYHQWQNLGYCD